MPLFFDCGVIKGVHSEKGEGRTYPVLELLFLRPLPSGPGLPDVFFRGVGTLHAVR